MLSEILSTLSYFLVIFIFEDILIPNAKSKKINPVLRLLCGAIVCFVIFGVMFLCFLVGINLLIEDFVKNIVIGIMLILLGFLAIWYFFYNVRNAKEKRTKLGI